MTMQLGEVAEIAMWADGRETTDELRPGEGRSPKVPKHISGPNVRLIVGEATVMGFRAKGSLKLLRDSVH